MGSLALPAGGIVYVDTSPLIFTVEKVAEYLPAVRPLWVATSGRTLAALTSELGLMECLIGPYKTQNAQLAADFELFFTGPNIGLEPISRPILRRAARLRAAVPKLRTPDAIHAATALEVGADLFVTNDYGFLAVPGLRVEVLDDVLKRP